MEGRQVPFRRIAGNLDRAVEAVPERRHARRDDCLMLRIREDAHLHVVRDTVPPVRVLRVVGGIVELPPGVRGVVVVDHPTGVGGQGVPDDEVVVAAPAVFCNDAEMEVFRRLRGARGREVEHDGISGDVSAFEPRKDVALGDRARADIDRVRGVGGEERDAARPGSVCVCSIDWETVSVPRPRHFRKVESRSALHGERRAEISGGVRSKHVRLLRALGSPFLRAALEIEVADRNAAVAVEKPSRSLESERGRGEIDRQGRRAVEGGASGLEHNLAFANSLESSHVVVAVQVQIQRVPVERDEAGDAPRVGAYADVALCLERGVALERYVLEMPDPSSAVASCVHHASLVQNETVAAGGGVLQVVVFQLRPLAQRHGLRGVAIAERMRSRAEGNGRIGCRLRAAGVGLARL